MDDAEKKRNEIMREFATQMLINATARFCDDVTHAKEDGLTPTIIRKLKAHLNLMGKVIDVADTAFDNDLLHCIMVSIPRRKTTPETDQEETDQEPQQSEPEPTNDQEETSEPNDSEEAE